MRTGYRRANPSYLTDVNSRDPGRVGACSPVSWVVVECHGWLQRGLGRDGIDLLQLARERAQSLPGKRHQSDVGAGRALC